MATRKEVRMMFDGLRIEGKTRRGQLRGIEERKGEGGEGTNS